jgi:hypothetical protein
LKRRSGRRHAGPRPASIGSLDFDLDLDAKVAGLRGLGAAIGAESREQSFRRREGLREFLPEVQTLHRQ